MRDTFCPEMATTCAVIYHFGNLESNGFCTLIIEIDFALLLYIFWSSGVSLGVQFTPRRSGNKG